MNKLTTTLLGAGLAGLAVLGVAAQANAAGESNQLIGPLMSEENAGVYAVYGQASGNGSTVPATTQSTTTPPASAPNYIVPNVYSNGVYSTGPVKGTGSADGLCLTAMSSTDTSAQMKTCDGSAQQTFAWDTGQGGWDTSRWNLYTTFDGVKMYVDYHSTQGTMALSRANNANAIVTSVLTPYAAPVSASVDSVDSVAKSAVVSGTGQPGGTVTVAGPNGNVTTTVAADGTWSVTVPNLNTGTNNLAVTQTVNGVTGAPVNLTADVAAASMTAVVDSVDSAAKTAVVSGTGEPGSTVTVTTPSGPVDFTVDPSGNWGGTVTGLNEGENTVTAVQTVNGVQGPATTLTIIVDSLGAPLVDPAIAGGAGALALMAFGGAYVGRRKNLIQA